jgi:flagellar motor switch protein FliM
VSLPLVVELGSASLTVRELLNLPVGQVIKLDTSAQGSLAVRVGEHTKFTARPGLVGRNMAVEITGVLN